MDQLTYWRQKLRRDSSLLRVQTRDPKADPFASRFGQVSVAEPGDTWPEFRGELMWPLCQINCTELPYMPRALADIALLRVYIAPDFFEADTDSGEGWCVRAAKDLSRMSACCEPDHGSEILPRDVLWQHVTDDFPSWDYAPGDLPQDLRDKYFDLFATVDGTKFGGWPTTIQSEIYWAPWNRHPIGPEYVFQIDTELDADWMWGDGGTGYFGRGTAEHRDRWAMSWQCY